MAWNPQTTLHSVSCQLFSLQKVGGVSRFLTKNLSPITDLGISHSILLSPVKWAGTRVFLPEQVQANEWQCSLLLNEQTHAATVPYSGLNFQFHLIKQCHKSSCTPFRVAFFKTISEVIKEKLHGPLNQFSKICRSNENSAAHFSFPLSLTSIHPGYDKLSSPNLHSQNIYEPFVKLKPLRNIMLHDKNELYESVQSLTLI